LQIDLSAIPSTSYRQPVASEHREAKAAFLVVFLAILTCVQGIRVSDVPVPFALLFSIFYLCVYRPPIPSAAPRIYALVISYLLIVSTRNALSDTGSVRDFLYIGICFTNLAITVVLFDLFRAVGAKTVGVALAIVALFEVALQLLEYSDIGGFNKIMAPALRFWAEQTNSQVFIGSEALADRAPGTFGAPTGAGLALYLIIRGAAIVLRRRRVIYLSIIPIIIGGARSALIVFLLWEVFAHSLLYWRRNFAFAMTGVLFLLAAIVTLIAFPSLITKVFLFRAFDVLPEQFAAGFSVVNRLRSIDWAFEHWQQFVTFGGITSAEMTAQTVWQGSTVDSELILRSLQFGFTGFICLLISNVWTGIFWRNPDSWFILFFALISSLTNAMFTDFVLFPFVIIYCLCIDIDQDSSSRVATAP
jgi:hypothetical protein